MNSKLEGEKVYLKAISEEYVETYLKWVTDPDVNRFTTVSALNIEEEKTWVKEMLSSKTDEVFNIFVQKEQKLIGNIGIHKLDDPDKRFMLGLLIGEKDYWGKGYGTDAFLTIIKYAFEQKGAEKLYLEVAVENEAAVKVYKKCGFKIVREYRSVIGRDGKKRDAYEMELNVLSCE